jgi:hypothetical protein
MQAVPRVERCTDGTLKLVAAPCLSKVWRLRVSQPGKVLGDVRIGEMELVVTCPDDCVVKRVLPPMRMKVSREKADLLAGRKRIEPFDLLYELAQLHQSVPPPSFFT